MNFTSKDTETLNQSYYQFLQNLKQFILENDFCKIEKIVPVIHYLLENAYFTDSPKMDLSSNFKYLDLPSNLAQGIQVMYGTCCCRHINSLQTNLLNNIGYVQAKDTFYFIDSENNWHKKEYGFGSNHLVTSLPQTSSEIIFDAYNGFTFRMSPDGIITQLDEPLTQTEKTLCSQYEDQTNIRRISKILKKYYNLRSLGIHYVYEEEIYGIT